MRRMMMSAVALCSGLLTACGPVKMPEVSTYSLTNLHVTSAVQSSHSSRTLGVTVPTASPGYTSANMVYMNIPYQLSHFALHKWVAPPAQMMLPIIVNALRATGHYKAVVATPYSAKTNFRLDFQVLELLQNFLSPQSKEQIAVQVNLFDNRTYKIVASRRFSVTVPATQNTPYGGVLAANSAMTKLSRQIANFAVRVAP